MVRKMKWFISALLLPLILAAGCAHNPHIASSSALSASPSSLLPQQIAVTPTPERLPQQPSEISAKSGDAGPNDINVEAEKEPLAVSPLPESIKSEEIPAKFPDASGAVPEFLDYVEEEGEEEKVGIADPLEPFNRAMHHFNDKLYFWVLKPVAQGYRLIVPETARLGVRNFFANITFPSRFVNCLLQANFKGAASELGRFVINTLCGIGGLLDVASNQEINIPKQDEDFGQTLGVFGVGQGFYINWPIWGPSGPRDTLGLVGDFFLHPIYFPTPLDVGLGNQGIRDGE